MRRVSIYLLGTAVVVAAIFVFLSFRPDIAGRVFLGAVAAPVEMELRDAYDVPAADEKTAAIVAAGRLFLDSLDDSQRQAATYRFTDNAQRSNWSNLPEGLAPRGGVKLRALSDSQRAALDRLLAEFLSEDGVRNITFQLAAADMQAARRGSGRMKFGSDYTGHGSK